LECFSELLTSIFTLAPSTVLEPRSPSQARTRTPWPQLDSTPQQMRVQDLHVPRSGVCRRPSSAGGTDVERACTRSNTIRANKVDARSCLTTQSCARCLHSTHERWRSASTTFRSLASPPAFAGRPTYARLQRSHGCTRAANISIEARHDRKYQVRRFQTAWTDALSGVGLDRDARGAAGRKSLRM